MVGEGPAEAARAFHAYREAQDAGIAAAVPGAPLAGIDAAMAAVLDHHGFGDAFLRPVFHGVGIEHEEAPIPGGHAVIHGEATIEEVQAGMVLAIGNCGIYREGVRRPPGRHRVGQRPGTRLPHRLSEGPDRLSARRR
jgi:Xaa-Pro aminopeptidase